MTDLVNDIKVEVQLPPEEGDNLLTNTSGQYGAWQWGVGAAGAGTSITGSGSGITLARNASIGPCYIVSDYLPVTPGMYANARAENTAMTTGHKAHLALQFYDSAYVYIAPVKRSTTIAAPGILGLSSQLVPAGAAYVQLVIEFDRTADTPGAGSANASASATFTQAMVTEVVASGVPSNLVTNVMPNGGFQYVTTGWSAGTNIGAISRFNGGGGLYYLRGNLVDGTNLGSAEYCYLNGPYVDIEPGENYSLGIDTLFPGGLPAGHSFTSGVLYRWYTSGNVQIGSDVWLSDGSTTPGWHRVRKIITAPAGAAKLRLHPYLRQHGPAITLSDAWYFQADLISVVKGSVLTPYFDGDTTDTAADVYAWTGTAGNSTSTRTSVGVVPYVETDEQYIDITGGYNQFTIERDELDISTMNGIVVDPALSPAKADATITPGRGIRVSALNPDTETFDRLFTGKLGPCSVEYDPLMDEKRQKVKISVTSTGKESALAQASRPGVALVAQDLPALALARAGVPWVVDGSTGFTPATSVADNDSATALDQVGLTRDTVAGIAWVDPYGVLQFETTPSAKSTGPSTMGPADYSAAGLKVSFSTDNLINQVLVTRLIRASDGSTEERTAGQTYEDGASVRKWGAHSAPLTIASTPNATSDAATAANRILAGNATPTLAIEEVAINSADERLHAFHDLFDLVEVTADTIDGEIVKDLRVARIKHEFTTERRPGGQGRWRTTYGFKVDGVVASPAIQPPLSQDKGTGIGAVARLNKPSAQSFASGTEATVTYSGQQSTTNPLYVEYGTWFSHAAGTFTLKADMDGVYQITGGIYFQGGARATRRVIAIDGAVNGGSMARLARNDSVAGATGVAPNGAASGVQATVTLPLKAGDQVRMVAYQDSGASLDTQSVYNGQHAYFDIMRIS